MNAHQIFGIASAVVTVASVLANLFPPYTIAGKVCHFLALNGPTVIGEVETATGAK